MGTLIPGREDSSEDVSTTALYIHSGEAVHHGNRKALVTREALLRDAELCECLFMLMCACTHSHWKRGGAKTHQTCTQTGTGIRSLLDLLSCWVSCSFRSQTRALSESQDTEVLFTPLFCPSGPVLARTLRITSARPVRLEFPSFAVVPSPLAGLQT